MENISVAEWGEVNITGNVLTEIKKLEEFSQNIIFCDPPYNLGSVWQIINGKPEVNGKAVDFMNNKWEGLTGEDLESMFINFYRILKHGGYCVFAGQMRQAMAFQYYAIASGFDMIEPIYSYNISNFPKALDVSKALDKPFGEEVIEYGGIKTAGHDGRKDHLKNGKEITENYKKHTSINVLAKKYNGIKSSICPLKQTTEVWFIFRKPFKTGTITKDIIAYEEGDQTIAISGLNIDGGRVGFEQKDFEEYKKKRESFKNTVGQQIYKGNSMLSSSTKINTTEEQLKSSENGRYPAQLFLDGAISYKREDIDLDNKDFLEFVGIDSDCIRYMDEEKAIDYVCAHLDKFNVAELLDEQSGHLKSGAIKKGTKYNHSNCVTMGYAKGEVTKDFESSEGGCSRILHNASFTLEELYQHIYYSKPSRYERNAGCSDLEVKNFSHDGRQAHCETPHQRHGSVSENNHPTLKSLKLLYNIIQLFKTIDIEKMKICIPFAGVRSEKIAWLSHGAIEENITAIEISEEYNMIGEARERFWIENDFFFKDEKEMQSKIKVSIEKESEYKEHMQGELF